ncbi:hypothetical protein RCZ01_22670 [Capnocytophaga felis]|uniref:Uncharacterized protein n=1 Tax=Capnocytophaga felis TaxID=2267611 RepID=A0A5M4BCI7_9FLAO|nr:hypothetical protein RCZ01_22670 [Capnocytophaga felis]GET49485.1 hypothetical protein RCZ02_23160 [Capnocytophaga felis]
MKKIQLWLLLLIASSSYNQIIFKEQKYKKLITKTALGMKKYCYKRIFKDFYKKEFLDYENK